MKNKDKVLAVLVEAYKANKNIPVLSVEDCKRKIIVNDAIAFAVTEIDRESDEEKKEETDDRDSGERGQAVSE